jgi:conjugal transfer pilus assembly protein TraB
MLGGADASASVTSQANPTPMLFRIIEEGTLPNHRQSHLKDCIVIAAVMGDISSERGEIRLERMSCTHHDNEVVDMSVEGTVFDPSGKNGIRGTPVWREGTLLQRAFVAGALSGIADGISQRYVTNSVSPLGSTQNVSGRSIFQYGTAHGASSALDKLADYTIQRAEQYHPVIQLSAGTTVDIVFLRGFYLDGKDHESEASRDIAAISANIELPKPVEADQEEQPAVLPLSDAQITKLKTHQKELGITVGQTQ